MLTALAVQGAVVVLAAMDAPFELRLPLALAYTFAIPGFAIIGLLRLSDPTTEAALSLTSSIAICTAVAQMLAWLDRYSLTATLTVLTVVTTAGLLTQLRAELSGSGQPTAAGNGHHQIRTEPDQDGPRDRAGDQLWPRSFWS